MLNFEVPCLTRITVSFIVILFWRSGPINSTGSAWLERHGGLAKSAGKRAQNDRNLIIVHYSVYPEKVIECVNSEVSGSSLQHACYVQRLYIQFLFFRGKFPLPDKLTGTDL